MCIMYMYIYKNALKFGSKIIKLPLLILLRQKKSNTEYDITQHFKFDFDQI